MEKNAQTSRAQEVKRLEKTKNSDFLLDKGFCFLFLCCYEYSIKNDINQQKISHFLFFRHYDVIPPHIIFLSAMYILYLLHNYFIY